MGIVNLSADASNVALDAIGKTMDGGAIELLDGDGRVLVTLPLSSPAVQKAKDGEIVFAPISEGIAVNTDIAQFARIVGNNNMEVLSCDVGNFESNATIKLVPQLITKGAPVRINSFRLAMP